MLQWGGWLLLSLSMLKTSQFEYVKFMLPHLWMKCYHCWNSCSPLVMLQHIWNSIKGNTHTLWTERSLSLELIYYGHFVWLGLWYEGGRILANSIKELKFCAWLFGGVITLGNESYYINSRLKFRSLGEQIRCFHYILITFCINIHFSLVLLKFCLNHNNLC